MEGQLQLRREDEEEEQLQEEEEERATKMKELPLESSPHLKCTDLENYKIMLGYATAKGHLYLNGDGAAAATTLDGSHLSQRDAAAIDRKLK